MISGWLWKEIFKKSVRINMCTNAIGVVEFDDPLKKNQICSVPYNLHKILILINYFKTENIHQWK